MAKDAIIDSKKGNTGKAKQNKTKTKAKTKRNSTRPKKTQSIQKIRGYIDTDTHAAMTVVMSGRHIWPQMQI